MEQENPSIFGSRTRTLVLEEVAKAVQPLNASSIARAAGVDPKNVYEEFSKLKQMGIFDEVTIGKKQNGCIYSDTQMAIKLKEFIKITLERKQPSIVDKIASFFPITDYYISLPVSLRISFDVFYSPAYLLLFVNKENRAKAEEFRRSLGDTGASVLLKPISLWGREFKYDETLQASLATNEQAIADGLNYYDDVREKEVIRTLVMRTSEIDLTSVVEKLDGGGITRLWAILAIKDAVLGDVDSNLLDLTSRRREPFLKGFFRSDLANEIIPLLLSNDESDRKYAFTSAATIVSRITRSLVQTRYPPVPLQIQS